MHGAASTSGVIGGAHLTGDLRFTAHRRIQATGHAEQVADRRIARAKLERRQVVRCQSGPFADDLVRAALRRESEVQLDPVAGRDDDAIRPRSGKRRGGDPLACIQGRDALVQMEQRELVAGRVHRWTIGRDADERKGPTEVCGRFGLLGRAPHARYRGRAMRPPRVSMVTLRGR